MKITERNLRELLAMHERRAQALREILDDAIGQQRESKQRRSQTVLEQAIALDADRRSKANGRAATPGRRSSRKGGTRRAHKETVAERRQRGARFLAMFDKHEPQALPNGMGIYVTNGYLERRGDGYVRTSKEYVV